MSRIHDMGGRFGDGPIPQKDDAQVFHSDWEAHAMAITVLSGAIGAWNIDASRHARETLRPRDYARFTYYEKWLAALADLLVKQGLATAEEIRAALGDAPPSDAAPLHDKALRAADVPASQIKRVPYERKGTAAPKFAPGQPVRTASRSPNAQPRGGHTRLPQYAQGRVGQVVQCHGCHVFPDSNAHFKGEAPEPLYAVAFTAAELWGAGAESPEDTMVLDLWESYLSPVAP